MKVSRRKLAMVVVEQLRSATDRRKVANALAAYLVEHKMANQADLLVKDIARLLGESENQLLAEVVSAFPLSEQSRKNISQYLQTKTGAKTIELNESVDSSLIGGFTLRTPGYELDASVRHTLNQLQA